MASTATFTPGKQYSLILHGILLLIMIFGLPNFFHRKIDNEPTAISVDILPIAPMSNVKPQEKSEPKPEKKPIEEKKTERKATAETRKVEPKPQEKPEPVKAKDVFKVPEKKPEKKVEKPKPKVDELDSVLKSVKETAKAEESKRPTEKVTQPNKTEAKSETYDNSQPLSMSEKDNIRSQFQRCWSVPAGAKDAQNLVVTLHITVNEDGSVTNVELSGDSSRYNSDSFFRAAADSAMRAVRECSPLKSLPTDKYGSWKDMELTFDPKDML